MVWHRISCIPALLLCIGCRDAQPVVERGLAERYDHETGQRPVDSHAEIDAVLASLPTVRGKHLPRGYRRRTGSDQAPFVSRLRRAEYRMVAGRDRFRFLVGNHRIADFMAHDEAYDAVSAEFDHAEALPFLLDPRVPHIILDLQHALVRGGYDGHAFVVREAHRHPDLNARDGGVSRSRHIYGEAVDLVVGDVDRDGDADEDDKALIIEILDRDLVGDQGGIGRYPGYDTVHFDVRGRRARWDTY